MARAVAQAAQAGRIDMLVAAAGIGFSGPLLSSDDAWARLKKLQARLFFVLGPRQLHHRYRTADQRRATFLPLKAAAEGPQMDSRLRGDDRVRGGDDWFRGRG